MRDITTKILFGDSREVLKKIGNNAIDLIVTSPPYADRRKNTYGGIAPEKYVEMAKVKITQREAPLFSHSRITI